MKIRAKRIAWIHHNPDADHEYWDESLYGFKIKLRSRRKKFAFPYMASLAAGEEVIFKTVEAAQAWCQHKADQMVSKWAELVED